MWWTLGAAVDLGFAVCDWLVSDFYVYLSIDYSACYHWWIVCWFGCFLPCFLLLFYFFILIIYCLTFYFNKFILFYLFYSIFLSFFSFLPFLLSCVNNRVLVLQPGVRPEIQSWENWVQDMRPPESSQPHIIAIGERSPRDLHLNAKIQLHSTTSNFQCWTPHDKQLARQEHNPTH